MDFFIVHLLYDSAHYAEGLESFIYNLGMYKYTVKQNSLWLFAIQSVISQVCIYLVKYSWAPAWTGRNRLSDITADK